MMSDWSLIYKKFGLDTDFEPDCWQLLGIHRSHGDLGLLDAALASRRRLLTSLEMTTDQLYIRKFEAEVLLPAYIKACESLNETEHLPEPHADGRLGMSIAKEDGSEPQGEDDIYGLKDLPDGPLELHDQKNEMQGVDDPDDIIGLKKEEFVFTEFEQEKNVPVSELSDEPLPLSELLGDSSAGELISDKSNDSAFPLTGEQDHDYSLAEADIAGQEDISTEHVPVLEALDDLPDDFLDSIEPDLDRSSGEPEQEPDGDDDDLPSRSLTPDKILGYVLAIIPIIALIIFISFLFSTDKKDNTEGQLISDEDIAQIEIANKKNISEAIKNQVVESGFKAQAIPDNFLLMLDQLIASYSSGQERQALLEDIAISLQAWQMIAGNISDTSAFSHILESQLFRNNDMAFDLSEQENDRLAYVLSASDSEVALTPAFYNSVMKSANTNQKRRMIELAGVSGTAVLRDLMLDTLKGKEDPEISCRIVRAFCLWLNASDQSELLTLVSSSRRDLSRRIFDNLNMRYASVLENTSLADRFLPGSFTRREIDICLKWWQENILSLGIAGRPGQNNSLAEAKGLPADEYAVLLAGIWKNSYILNAMLRSSVSLPVMSPDIEINAGCELLIDQVLAESMSQVKNALLAVIYEKYAGDPLLNEIDLIRFGSREYDFIDADLRAQARANEILIYCKIMNGEKYESRKTLRYNPGSNTLLLVRDALFEAIKNYASSKIAVYNRQPQSFGDLRVDFELDFELVGESEYRSGDENAEADLQKVLVQLRADPFSQELYQKASMISHNRDNVDSESLIYLQLGVKALSNRKFGAGSAIAIDCFSKAINYPLGRKILEHNMPSLVQVLLEEPGFVCASCGNSGYVICPACNGSMFVRCDACRGQGSVVDRTEGRQACYDCGGTGKLYCVDCNGSGVQRCVSCSEYISNIDLFLPDDQQLNKLQQAINHAALRYKIAITPIE